MRKLIGYDDVEILSHGCDQEYCIEGRVIFRCPECEISFELATQTEMDYVGFEHCGIEYAYIPGADETWDKYHNKSKEQIAKYLDNERIYRCYEEGEYVEFEDLSRDKKIERLYEMIMEQYE